MSKSFCDEPVRVVITGTDKQSEVSFCMYDPKDPAGTNRRVHVPVGSWGVELPAGWVLSTSDIPPDATFQWSTAREKDYGI